MKDFIEKFAEAIECENPENLMADTKFRDLPEWSSLAALSIIAMADEEYDTEISGTKLRSAETLLDLFNLISNK